MTQPPGEEPRGSARGHGRAVCRHRRPGKGGSRRLALAALLVLAAGHAAGADLVLRAPLTTVAAMRCPRDAAARVVTATLTVPEDAPRDLGVGAFVSDRHGRWFQRPLPGALLPGRQRISIALGPDDLLVGEPHRADWGASAVALTEQGGLFFWSASASRAVLRIDGLAVAPLEPPPRPAAERLLDLQPEALGADGIARIRTGERWTVDLGVQPMPANPYDAAQFSLEAVVTQPDGSELRIPGFYHQPMARSDRGDREELRPIAAGRFAVRFRPRQAGVHRLRLEARWQGGAAVACDLPPLQANGPAWDDYVRVDREDPRFFSAGGALFWPIGLNLRSVYDLRCSERLGTRITPNRGTLSYEAFLRRLAASGANATEIWLSSWNLALEWRGDWEGYHGQGRYNEENAWRLDHILELCGELGIRVNLVVNNHGQASEQTDSEWASNPYARERGGKLRRAEDFFTDPWALAGQERMRRYLVARYADHPSILGWKLWSEVNLTAGQRQEVRRWHQSAIDRWHHLDVYDHGVTTHWSGDFRTPDPGILALPGLDYACIDAYHTSVAEGGWMLADLLFQGVHQPHRGLGRFAKPVLVTEFGGNWDAAPLPQIIAEHASGPWAALVSGNGGAPMLWWFEWVDQSASWGPYTAIAAFLRGEDLRSPSARAVLLETSAGPALWARGWSRPAHMLGYVLDAAWGSSGEQAPPHQGVRVQVGSQIAAGTMVIEWWDADLGRRLSATTFDHPGGALWLAPPDFARHLAFKLYRPVPGPLPGPRPQP